MNKSYPYYHMNRNPNHIANTLFFLALAIIVLLGINSYRSFQRMTDYEKQVVHTHDVLEASEAIVSNMKDCETGTRGYVLTGEREFLQPFYAGERQNTRLLQYFMRLTADNAVQQQRGRRLAYLTGRKIDYSRHFIRIRQTKGSLPARELARLGEGKAVMDSIRRLVARINAHERQLLVRRQQSADEAAATSKALLLTGTLASLLLLFGFFWALHRQMRRRKENEHQLFLQNQWYNQTLVSLGDGVITINTQGVITMINRSACELSGWSSFHAVGKYIEDVFVITNETTGKKVQNPALKALETKAISFLENHTYLHKKDGGRIFIDDSGAPILNEQGETVGAVLIFRDITQRKVAEQERNMFFNISVDMIGVADLTGYFRRINPSFGKTLGYSDKEFLSKAFSEFIHEEDLAATALEMEKLSKGIPTVNFSNRYRCKDGSYKWLEWNVSPIGETLYAIARDTTERHELARKMANLNSELEQRVSDRTAELEKQKEFTDDILNKIPAEITVFDQNRNYLYMNSEAMPDVAMRGTLIGHNDLHYCRLMKYDARTIARREAIFDKFIRFSENLEWVDHVTDLEGCDKYLLRKLQKLSDRQKFLLISYDITALKKSEMQKRQYTKALEEMMFITSHKVRNDVTRLMSIAELLNLSITQEELAEIIGFTSESISSLDKVTEDLTLFIHEQKRE